MRPVVAALIALCFALPAFAGTPASNKAAAESDAASLLSSVVLPPDAEALAAEPQGDGGALADAAMKPADPNLIVRTGFFRAPEAAGDVLAFVKAHAPAGTAPSISGSGDTTDGRTVDFTAFDRPPVAHVLSTRRLLVAVVRLDDGSTGIRVDAQVQWLIPRPAASMIRGAHLVTIRAGKRTIEVSQTDAVRRIVADLNGAEFESPSIRTCPMAPSEPPHPRLTFRTRRGGRVLGYAHIRPTGCARADLAIGGKRYGSLDLLSNPGAKLIDELRRLGALPRR